MRFNDVLLEWLNESHKFYIKENTLMRYRCSINNHIIYYFSNYQIEDINPRVIQKYIYELKETSSDRTRRPLSNSTINNIIAILKLFFNYCVEYEIIAKNPMIKVKNLPITRYKENKVFSKNNQKKFENYIVESNDASNFIYIFALYTGLRMGELLPLVWKDIDLRIGEVHVTKNQSTIKDDNDHWVERISSPKTSRSYRTIPLPRFLIIHLKHLKRLKLSKYVFTNNEGERLSRKRVTANYAHILKVLKIQYIPFHSLRHTFATRALENNMDIKTISEVLGHSNAAMTLNIYSHSLPDQKRLQMRKMKRII